MLNFFDYSAKTKACQGVWLIHCLNVCLLASLYPPSPLKDKYNPIITVILIISYSYHYLIVSRLHLPPSCLHSRGRDGVLRGSRLALLPI